MLALVLVPLVLSCQLLLSRHNLDGDPDPDARAPADPCTHAVPPPPPRAGDVPSVGDLWFATRQIILPLGEDGGVKPGLDLDDSCTCLPDLRDGAAPCRTPFLRTPPPSPKGCDFDGGVDDSLGAAALAYGSFLESFDLARTVNDGIDGGARTFLVYLANYNGQADDPDVDVGVVTSGGLFDPLRCEDAEAPIPEDQRASLQHTPLWDGCDRWSPVHLTTHDGYPARKAKTTKAYVSNHTVVAHLDTVSAQFFGQAADLTRVVAVATITPRDGGPGYGIKGFLTGRIAFTAAADLVGHTDAVDKGGNRVGTCATPFWDIIAGDLCSARDTLLDPANEFHQGAVCDAVSIAIGFVAEQAQVSDDEHDPSARVADCDATVECQ